MLGNRSRNGIGQLADFGDGFDDPRNRGNGGLSIRLHGGDLSGDFLGGLASLTGQIFDFMGDNGKTFAGVSGAGTFDGGI